jgi:hypothetical protein
MPITTLRERITHERWMASQSTFTSCVCGFNHVPGCKVRITERLLVVVAVLVIVAAVVTRY